MPTHRECICGQHLDWSPPKAPAKDWVLTEVHDRGPREYYRYRTTGLNLNYPPCHPDHRFSWRVPDLDEGRYDTTNAAWTYADGVQPTDAP